MQEKLAEAIITYYPGTKFKNTEVYLLKNKIHRTDGPAKIFYNPDGSLCIEEYWQNDCRYNSNGPLRIEYENGIKKIEAWIVSPFFYHRTDGPAYIEYDANGLVVSEKYYLHNELYDGKNEKFLKEVKKIEISLIYK
jgi:hypothetical protein